MDNKQLHIRLPNEDMATLDELAGNILSRQQVATMILSAAIDAVRQNRMKLSFPPLFTVGMAAPDTERIVRLNEAAHPAKVKK